jgi:hypothetical protein
VFSYFVVRFLGNEIYYTREVTLSGLLIFTDDLCNFYFLANPTISQVIFVSIFNFDQFSNEIILN